MRGDPRSQEQRQRFMAYMSEDGAPAEERGLSVHHRPLAVGAIS
jgi:hypothetical protein